MQQKQSQQDIDSLYSKYKEDRLFQNLYMALVSLNEQFNTITPVEIWEHALFLVDNMTHGENDIFEIDALPSKIYSFFAEYQNENENIIHKRDNEDTDNICFSVELCMLYQLTRYQPEWNNHPYLNYCLGMFSHIQSDPRFNSILSLITDTNDRYENHYQNEVEPFDYVSSIIKEDSIIKDAVQLSIDCSEYLAYGYDEQWLKNFWTELLFSKNKESIIRDLTNSSKYTTIFGIIGMLVKNGVYNATPTQLSHLSFQVKMDLAPDTVRRYINKGTDLEFDPYAKFVKEYISNHPKLKK